MIKIPGLTPPRKQSVLIATEDGRIVHDTLKVEKGYAVNHDTTEAWVLSDSLIRQRKTGDIFQALSERSADPISLNGGDNSKLTTQTIQAINAMVVDQTLVKIEKKSAQNKLIEIVGFIAVLFAICVVVMVLAGFFMSGKIDLPF